MSIKAKAYSDDQTIQIEFDAEQWFISATDQEIVDLAACDWGGDYPADVVIYSFSNLPEVARLLDYVELQPVMPNGDPVGFECHVCEQDTMAWLARCRRSLFDKIIALSG